ncbi:MAG: ornithine cyclodeaminase family protein [Acidobacteriia bacterium]|nr:ornithine cyclodeaminase family protein [Terriglobia bacterium]
MSTLSEAEIRHRLDPLRVINAIESAFRDLYPNVVIPLRTHLETDAGVFLIMPCYDRAGHALGMKLVMVQSRPARPEDRIQATYLLLEAETGLPKLVIPANYLTDLRTAATSAIATKFLAREDARVLGIFGTGRQARAHIKVVPLVRGFERVLICGRDANQVVEFAREISVESGLRVEPVDASTCAAESDVLCTCTSSAVPLFDGSLLRPGTHLNAVGAFQPRSRELDSAAVGRSRIVVETYDGAPEEAGDLLIPRKEGVISRDHIVADLHQLVSRKRLGRTQPSDITLFKSVGCALEDLATAKLLA